MQRRATLTLALLAAALAAGCASMNTLTSEVASYGEWPQGRAPGRYAFERLPSQQAQAEEAVQLEAVARGALEKAGFTAAMAGAEPDVLVQLGVRTAQTLRAPWDDALWWRGSFGWSRRGAWRGPWRGPGWGWGATWDAPRYEREVGVLIRDRASGKPLYETRAVSEGGYRADAALFAAMFEAALADFPRPALSPRSVTVPLAQ